MKHPLPFTDELEEAKKTPKYKLRKDEKANPENCGGCPYYIMDKIPHFSVAAAAVILTISRGTVRNFLSARKELFEPPIYRWRGRCPRVRVLYPQDIKVINTLLTRKKYRKNILHDIPKEMLDAR